MQARSFNRIGPKPAVIRWARLTALLGLVVVIGAFGCGILDFVDCGGRYQLSPLCHPEGFGACCTTNNDFSIYCDLKTREDCLSIPNSVYWDQHSCEDVDCERE